jgi:hypothetical protein
MYNGSRKGRDVKNWSVLVARPQQDPATKKMRAE